MIASRAASTSGRSSSVDRSVADAHHLDRDAVRVLDLGGQRSQRSWQASRRAAPRSSNSQDRRSRSWARASPPTVAGSPAVRWISARVWSTESCRWAATSARSSERTRASRSSLRSGDSRSSHGPTMSPSPTMPKARPAATLSATEAARAQREQRDRGDEQQQARAASALSAPPARADDRRIGPTRRDGSSQRSRWASSACHQSTATPAPASEQRPDGQRPPVAIVTGRSTADRDRPDRRPAARSRPAGASRRPARLPCRVAASRPGRAARCAAGRQEQPQAGVQHGTEAAERRRRASPSAPTARARRGAGPAPRPRHRASVVGVASGPARRIGREAHRHPCSHRRRRRPMRQTPESTPRPEPHDGAGIRALPDGAEVRPPPRLRHDHHTSTCAGTASPDRPAGLPPRDARTRPPASQPYRPQDRRRVRRPGSSLRRRPHDHPGRLRRARLLRRRRPAVVRRGLAARSGGG